MYNCCGYCVDDDYDLINMLFHDDKDDDGIDDYVNCDDYYCACS